MEIREALESDHDDVINIEREAFGSEDEAELVAKLLLDPSAEPYLSLIAIDDQKPVGHILFTKARLEPKIPLSISILAPLAVIPKAQKKGVGGKLIEHGLKALAKSGVDLVFVLGHPEYYPRHGFKPAGILGFEAPYPIPSKNAAAWMVQELRDGIIGKYSGRVICSDVLNEPEYWSE